VRNKINQVQGVHGAGNPNTSLGEKGSIHSCSSGLTTCALRRGGNWDCC
jgi:hypothetical protein